MFGKSRLLAIVAGLAVGGLAAFADSRPADAYGPVRATVRASARVAVAPARWGYGYGWGYRGYYGPRYYSFAPSIYPYAYSTYYAPTYYAPSYYSYPVNTYSYAPPVYYNPPAVRVGVRPVYRGRYFW